MGKFRVRIRRNEEGEKQGIKRAFSVCGVGKGNGPQENCNDQDGCRKGSEGVRWDQLSARSPKCGGCRES